jgi:hypothetical protein
MYNNWISGSTIVLVEISLVFHSFNQSAVVNGSPSTARVATALVSFGILAQISLGCKNFDIRS